MFVYIWTYDVREDAIAEFVRVYGPDGEWAALFRKHVGYERTELLRDVKTEHRYCTVDYWRSREDREDFLREHATAFAELDRRCEALTVGEVHIGDFASDASGKGA